ncbi:MAG: fatty acid desaturase [Roseovarius sp.]
MPETPAGPALEGDAPASPTEWTRRLAPYRGPDPARSLFELAVTLLPFLAAFGLAWAALSVSPWLGLLLSPLAAAFLVRLFMIQHDCGHGAFFRSRALNDWMGRVLGVLTLTPYDVWRRTHAIHHASTGNLDRRGTGDLPTLTVAEYRAKPWHMRALYRLVRHPLFLFGVVPFYSFFLQNRLPAGLWRGGWRYWVSALATDAAIFALVAALWALGGWELLVFVYLPTMLLSASAGMWLFYVQHQFEETWWEREEDWQVQEAALHGSSYYVLPPVLNWLTANIGMHHVHHLASRIPFYRLGEALRENEALGRVQRLTLRESLRCARLHLWDERKRRLVSFAEAGALPG